MKLFQFPRMVAIPKSQSVFAAAKSEFLPPRSLLVQALQSTIYGVSGKSPPRDSPFWSAKSRKNLTHAWHTQGVKQFLLEDYT